MSSIRILGDPGVANRRKVFSSPMKIPYTRLAAPGSPRMGELFGVGCGRGRWGELEERKWRERLQHRGKKKVWERDVQSL